MKNLKKNGMKDANFISILTYWWMNDFFKYGSKNSLEESDMLELIESDTSKVQCTKLERNWKKQIYESNDPSLVKAILVTFRSKLIIAGLVTFVEEVLRLGIALMIAYLVRYFENRGVVPIWQAYVLAAGVTSASLTLALMHHTLLYQTCRMGWHLRVALCGMMYKKTLRLSQRSLRKTTTGKIVNLAANDILRYDQLMGYLHYAWIGPLQCVIVAFILWEEFGVAILAGMAVLCFLLLMQSFCGKAYSKLRLRIATITDNRIRLMNEIISGMRIIKMYTWEEPYAKLLSETRKKEVRKILLPSYVKGCSITLYIIQEKLTAFSTLLTYVLTGGVLTTFKVFLLIALLASLRLPAGNMFFRAIEKIAESKSSTKRIKEFLLLDELSRRKTLVPDCVAILREVQVEFKRFSASWKSDTELSQNSSPTLSDVSFRVKAGELIAVVGSVGSGKSSLLSAILGELPATAGEMFVSGTLTYADQTPWVFSGTVRDNILFGEAFHESRYKSVISSCSLTKDLETFPGGDQALVGERGVALSGGQKARLNLARAMYKCDADIYLFDDPLSAVDPAVANHIYKECISGLLSNKTRILVTNQLQLLETADKILVLKNGRIIEFGSYCELKDKETVFATLITSKENKCEDSECEFSVTQASVQTGNCVMNAKGGPEIAFSTGDLKEASTISALSYKTAYMEEAVIPIEIEEELEKGSIGIQVYVKYFRAAGSITLLAILVLLFIASHAIFILNDWWLSVWAGRHAKIETTGNISVNLPRATIPQTYESEAIDDRYYLGIYTAFCLALVSTLITRFLLNLYICVSSGITMHKDLLDSVLKAPIRFFDTNPVGRILNRFSKDMGQVDELLPIEYQDFLYVGRNSFQNTYLTSITVELQ